MLEVLKMSLSISYHVMDRSDISLSDIVKFLVFFLIMFQLSSVNDVGNMFADRQIICLLPDGSDWLQITIDLNGDSPCKDTLIFTVIQQHDCL